MEISPLKWRVNKLRIPTIYDDDITNKYNLNNDVGELFPAIILLIHHVPRSPKRIQTSWNMYRWPRLDTLHGIQWNQTIDSNPNACFLISMIFPLSLGSMICFRVPHGTPLLQRDLSRQVAHPPQAQTASRHESPCISCFPIIFTFSNYHTEYDSSWFF